jgi:hypothetical protein
MIEAALRLGGSMRVTSQLAGHIRLWMLMVGLLVAITFPVTLRLIHHAEVAAGGSPGEARFGAFIQACMWHGAMLAAALLLYLSTAFVPDEVEHRMPRVVRSIAVVMGVAALFGVVVLVTSL